MSWLSRLTIYGQTLLSFALGDREEVKMNNYFFQKTTFLQKSLHFLEILKFHHILALSVMQTVATEDTNTLKGRKKKYALNSLDL